MYFCIRICDSQELLLLTGSGFSAVGSAHVWGARGRWFESSNPDIEYKYHRISQLERFSGTYFSFKTVFYGTEMHPKNG